MARADTVSLTETHHGRLTQLLEATLHQVRREQIAARPRMHEVLTELGYILEDQIMAIENAEEDDRADAEMACVLVD